MLIRETQFEEELGFFMKIIFIYFIKSLKNGKIG